MLKEMRYLLEALFAYTFFLLFYILPIDVASYVGGKIFEFLGKFLPASKIAMRNLDLCLPNLTQNKKRIIIKKMWNNLGRIVGELPHWYRISDSEFKKRVKINQLCENEKGEFISTENFDLHNNRVMMLSGHFGNWELFNRLSQYKDLKLCFIYRHLNNPYINTLVNYTRKKCGAILVTKSVDGIKRIIKEIKHGSGVMPGMLFDQRYDDGIRAMFFGIETPTAPSHITMSQQYGLNIFMCKALRSGKGARYDVTFYQLKNLNDKKSDVKEKLEYINKILMNWIIKNPEQWFWVHKKFPREFYK